MNIYINMSTEFEYYSKYLFLNIFLLNQLCISILYNTVYFCINGNVFFCLIERETFFTLNYTKRNLSVIEIIYSHHTSCTYLEF